MIKLGIVMDPISSINIKKDTSFAMLLEAQRRGWNCITWRWGISICVGVMAAHVPAD